MAAGLFTFLRSLIVLFNLASLDHHEPPRLQGDSPHDIMSDAACGADAEKL